MFRNYIKIAWRSLFKHKLYSLLNIAGLTFGLVCFFLIGLFVFDELTFDEQHQNADRIYRLIEHKSVKGEQTVIAGGGYKLAEESKKVIADIENTTRISRTGRANLINPERPEINFQENITLADANFLKVFDFPLVEGNKETALSEPIANSAFLIFATRVYFQASDLVVGKSSCSIISRASCLNLSFSKKSPSNFQFNFMLTFSNVCIIEIIVRILP